MLTHKLQALCTEGKILNSLIAVYLINLLDIPLANLELNCGPFSVTTDQYARRFERWIQVILTTMTLVLMLTATIT